MTAGHRVETDSFGNIEVASDKYWGAQAQRSLAQLRQELAGSWLMTVEGEARTSLLTIKEIARESEESYLLNATFGWTDGVHPLVRIEVIQSAQELALIVRTSAGALISPRLLRGALPQRGAREIHQR